MKSKSVLIVEDDVKILSSNLMLLEREGYIVLIAETLSKAREQLRKAIPDAVVLDIMLPDGNGLDFLYEVRKTSAVPVLLLTALNTSADVIKGLEAGGDDYLPKPYDVGVFLTRVKAMLRRADVVPEIVKKGALSLSISSSQAFLNGEDMLLPQKEFALLLLFAQNENRVMTVENLYEKVWGQSLNDDANPVRYQISRLRKKMAGTGYTIVAEYGDGYRFEKDDQNMNDY